MLPLVRHASSSYGVLAQFSKVPLFSRYVRNKSVGPMGYKSLEIHYLFAVEHGRHDCLEIHCQSSAPTRGGLIHCGTSVDHDCRRQSFKRAFPRGCMQAARGDSGDCIPSAVFWTVRCRLHTGHTFVKYVQQIGSVQGHHLQRECALALRSVSAGPTHARVQPLR
mmetsp:Transcript_39760/g.105310  ORF Transcript_39760/g.105310 Transcript_39760/m.105310 type:complete len:165 (-) Transcript_39760:151-645(-)